MIFLADFYILEMENESSSHGSKLSLGRPFFMTTKTKIDVHAGTLSPRSLVMMLCIPTFLWL